MEKLQNGGRYYGCSSRYFPHVCSSCEPPTESAPVSSFTNDLYQQATEMHQRLHSTKNGTHWRWHWTGWYTITKLAPLRYGVAVSFLEADDFYTVLVTCPNHRQSTSSYVDHHAWNSGLLPENLRKSTSTTFLKSSVKTFFLQLITHSAHQRRFILRLMVYNVYFLIAILMLRQSDTCERDWQLRWRRFWCCQLAEQEIGTMDARQLRYS